MVDQRQAKGDQADVDLLGYGTTPREDHDEEATEEEWLRKLRALRERSVGARS